MTAENTIRLEPDDARRLADALIRRRIELGYRSARALSAAINTDARTITGLEGARQLNVSRNTLATLELALKWDPGYINALLTAAQGNRAFPHQQQIWLESVEASDEEIRVARAVAQAAFNSTLDSLRAQETAQ